MNKVNESSALGSLKFLTGSRAGQTVLITSSTTTIGRAENNSIIISDPSISREHAQIIWDGNTWIIKKLAPQNTMTLNQREITQAPLNDHDTIGIGSSTTFLFSADAQHKPKQPPTEQSSNGAGLPAAQQPGLPGPSPSSPANQNAPAPYAQGANALYPPPPINNAPINAAYNQPGNGQNNATPPVYPPNPYPMNPVAGVPNVRSANGVQVANNDYGTMTQMANDPLASAHVPTGVPSLEISTNTDRERHVHPLPPNQPVFDIGRDPSNTIVIDRPTVSGFHAQIVREGNQLVLVHPHPKRGHTLNGLSYNGHNVAGNEPFRAVLKRGDVIRISDENGTFVSLKFNDGSGQAQDVVPDLPPVRLGAPVITMGRAPDNMVVLNHPQVSGHHARLEQVQGGYRIIDLGSTNHTYVNTQQVSRQMLQPGDEIHIGAFKLTYTGTVLTQQDESNGIRIDALHLKKEGNKHIVLINDISITIPPRKFVALVGGSGAGKSTLMDALNGLRPAQQGAVLYNGQDYYTHLAAFSTQLGYVPQEDIIHRDLPVDRALYYAAKLRLPEDFTEKQIKDRIVEVLDDVEMKHRRHLLISKLSGGQRKRISIALELLANPSVFFLDEPTSGLDPGLDRKMMLLLRKLADKGHTIVLVTHATNNINACDDICFLCQGGRLAYFGPPNEAKAYFGKTDFAEIYSSLEPTEENPNIPAQAEERFRNSPDYRRYVVDPLQRNANQAQAQMQTSAITQPKRGNPWKQFWLLSMRYIELLLNDRVNLAILILQAPLIGLILFFMTPSGAFNTTSVANCPHHTNILEGTGRIVYTCGPIQDILNGPNAPLYIQAVAQQNPNKKIKTKEDAFDASIAPSGADAQKVLLIMAFAAIMFGCLNGSREIVKEAAIYRRERTVNLGIAPYLFSKIVVLGIFSLVQSLILVAFVNARSPFPNSIIFPPFMEIYISMALTSIAGLMTGLLISAIVPNNDRAMSLVPLPLIPQIIFAGVIFSLNSPGLQIPGAFFTARWSMAAMGSTVGLHWNQLQADPWSYVVTIYPALNSNGQPQATLHLLLTWGILAFMTIAQVLIISWFLKRKDVRR